MVEAEENAKECWKMGKLKEAREPETGTIILWVDKNIYSESNQADLNKFKTANNKIRRFVCTKTLKGALECLNNHPKEIDLLICSGSYCDQMIKNILKEFGDDLSYFQMVIYCYDIEKHKKKVHKYGLLRFVTKHPNDISILIRNFQRRLEKYSEGSGGNDEFKYFISTDYKGMPNCLLLLILGLHLRLNLTGK